MGAVEVEFIGRRYECPAVVVDGHEAERRSAARSVNEDRDRLDVGLPSLR